MRAALTAAGARLLEAVLAGGDDGYAGPHVKCAAGHQVGYAGRRPKAIATVLGVVRVMRAWYHCPECKHGFAPRDEQLGVAATVQSPGLREMIARAGAEVPFGKAAALIKDLAGIAVSAKTAVCYPDAGIADLIPVPRLSRAVIRSPAQPRGGFSAACGPG